MPTKAELIVLGRNWLQGAPHNVVIPDGVPIGWKNPLDFVCAKCASRILARGCHGNTLYKDPVYEDNHDGRRCDLCSDQYVWLKGRVWRFEGLVNANGKHSLVSVKDPALGLYALPATLRFCSEETMQAIDYFLGRGTPGAK